MASFTAHNIALDDGTVTAPEIGFTMDRHPVFVEAKRLLSVVFPDPTGVRLADLGCLEGGYSVEFARLGFNVTGIEVRESNIASCNYVKQKTNLPNLSFVHDNAWNIGAYGPFDVVFCCGVLYHLHRPSEFLKLISSCASRMVILQTHFATEEPDYQGVRLSELTPDEHGYLGRWCSEYASEIDFEAREAYRFNSWDNKASFWLKREYLLQAIIDAGFDICFEQFDHFPNVARTMDLGAYISNARGTFVGIKSQIPGLKQVNLEFERQRRAAPEKAR